MDFSYFVLCEVFQLVIGAKIGSKASQKFLFPLKAVINALFLMFGLINWNVLAIGIPQSSK